MSNPGQHVGAAGEALAAVHLEALGYRILERNFRCPAGEIDLIALDGRTLVFIEVKTRRNDRPEGVLAAITPQKQRKIERAARLYLARRRLAGRPARFDAVGIVLSPLAEPEVVLIRNAFEASSG